ncbi:DNA modification system-associated small protein [Paenibacillus ehimensis]|jgi:hypothetical protein|uniref:Uncharacterized protein n=1 Tax=Paenibacillus ehimensis TaxID=79264 RepID=A0ABT8VFR2_9BACL|nr:DNA modification system-associated small protein [Paenibacillus ehimensis]MDO3679808.1 hypothetical protein [Paenibacillus ehimensis]
MRNEIEVEELLRVLETIRSEQYPDIPAEIIREIVIAQFENQDDRTLGRRNTKKIIDDFLKEVVTTTD